MKTTLNQIRDCKPCQEGWKKLLKYLGKTATDDKDLSLLTILESNGLNDALWCLRAVEGFEREKRLYAIWCASQVRHLMTDERSLSALVVAERFAEGLATKDELTIAEAASWAAARADAAADRAANVAAAARAANAAAAAAAWAADAARAANVAAAANAARARAAWSPSKTEFIRMLTCIENGEKYEIKTVGENNG